MGRGTTETSPLRTYHVMARGVGGQLIFEDDRDRALFVRLLGKALGRLPVALVVWTLVENHVHLVLQGERAPISLFMKWLLGRYAVEFNKRHGRKGHLFQDRFRRVAVMDEAQLLATVRYVHQNAMRAGLCEGCSYRWNSFDEYLHGSGLCDQSSVWALIESEERFRELHQEPVAPARCLSLEGSLRGADAASVLERARAAVAPLDPGLVRGCGRSERDVALVVLHEAGLSFRQIELVTGVSKSVVGRVVKSAGAAAVAPASAPPSSRAVQPRRAAPRVRSGPAGMTRACWEGPGSVVSVLEWNHEEYMSKCSYKE